MKRIIYSLLFISSLIAFAGCNEITTEDTSKITYFINYELKGDAVMVVPVGSAFSDPGVVAMEGDKDVTSSVVVDGTVDANSIGIYTLTYSATNVDGFASSISRTVAVCDPSIETDISGTYTLGAESYRLYNKATKTSFSGYTCDITKAAPGIFFVSDFFAGYYDKRAKYGVNYAMFGYIKLNADNTIELLSSHINGWGDSIDKMANAVYDPAKKSIYWEVDYASAMTFYIQLNK